MQNKLEFISEILMNLTKKKQQKKIFDTENKILAQNNN